MHVSGNGSIERGKMCTENQYKKTELEILVTVISENCYRFHFSMSQNLKFDEQSVITGP